jgi:Zn finger protein HypA/HybF involved in hydrogenase expression
VHDYHAAEALVERLKGELDHPERVTEVRIRAAATYSPEALQQAYEMLTQGTPLKGSSLVVEERPDERECPSCGKSWHVSRDDLAGHLIVCPHCGAASAIAENSGIEVVGVIATQG